MRARISGTAALATGTLRRRWPGSRPDSSGRCGTGGLVACKRFIQAADLCEERIAQRMGIGRSDLRAINLLEEGPLPQSAIVRRLGLTPPTVTALVDRLVGEGLVRRAPHPTDRRVTLVELLPAAWGRLAAVYRPVGGSVLAAAEHLSAPQRHKLTSILNEWADVLDEQPA
jgi:DNA-binding MarR family transcriptional regulator